MPFAFLFHDSDLGDDTPMMTSLEIRNICLDARDEILRLQDQAEQQCCEILRLKLALSCALPVLETAADQMLDPDETATLITEATQVVALIRAAVDAQCLPPPRRSTPILIWENTIQ